MGQLKKMLVVESNEKDMDFMRTCFGEQYELLEMTEAGQMRGEQEEIWQVDLAVVDQFAALQELRKGIGRKIPVIFSAKDSEEAAVRALELGADDYFTRLTNQILLRKRVSDVLELQEERQNDSQEKCATVAELLCHCYTVLLLDVKSGELDRFQYLDGGVKKIQMNYDDSDSKSLFVKEMRDIYPDDVERIKNIVTRKNILKAYKEGKQEVVEVFRKCNNQNGIYEWYEMRLMIPVSESEDRLKVILTLNNISRSMETNSSLRAVDQIVSTASLEKNNFLLKVSQELQTPLNHIIGITNMLDGKDDLETASSYKKEIEDSANYIKNTLEDILDVSMYLKKDEVLTYSKVKISDIFKWLKAVFGPMAKQKEVNLEFSTSSACSNSLMLDKEKCMLVYYNLLMNALNYTPRGGIISVHTREVYERGNKVFIRSIIRDNGIGISEKLKEQLFDAHEKIPVDSTVGVGLGMTIVKNYLHMMNGAIHVESKHSKGTTFSITFAGEIPQGKPESTDTLENRKCDIKGRKIMVIEDNDINRSMTKNLLEKAGAEVLEAANGTEAINLFEQSRDGEVSVILSDIMMPEVNGLDVAAQIRMLDREDAKTIPIVAVTANTFDEDVARIFAYGMDAFVPKPVNRAAMYDVIDEVLRG